MFPNSPSHYNHNPTIPTNNHPTSLISPQTNPILLKPPKTFIILLTSSISPIPTTTLTPITILLIKSLSIQEQDLILTLCIINHNLIWGIMVSQIKIGLIHGVKIGFS